MAPMNSKASILNHAKVGRDCPQRGIAATEPREAFGVRRIPALCESSARLEAKAPEYGALQTLRALVCQSGFSLQKTFESLLLFLFGCSSTVLRTGAPYRAIPIKYCLEGPFPF